MGKKVILTWRNLEVSIPTPRPSLRQKITRALGLDDAENTPRPPKVILRKVNGDAGPGDLIALMGASGAGKTTLLNTLSARNTSQLTVTGEILVNKKRIGRKITKVTAYVQQEDLFFATMSVREHLQFQAMLRMDKKYSLEERYQRVEEVLQELGLMKCANSLIGNPTTIRGISGGERKRLAFASEILDDPPLLFSDEPTSGLDSFMALSVVNCLQSLAQKGRAIICTIHQPPSEVFALFNKLLLLAEGRTAFLGPMVDAVPYFASLGHVCPAHFNPADFFVYTLAIIPGKEEESVAHVKAINEAFAKVESREMILAAGAASESDDLIAVEVTEDNAVEDRAVGKNENESVVSDCNGSNAVIAMETETKQFEPPPLNREGSSVAFLATNHAELLKQESEVHVTNASRPSESTFTQLKALMWRAKLTTIREPLLVKVRLFQTIFLGIVVGLIFLRLDNNQRRVQDATGALFFLVVQMAFGTIFPLVQQLPVEFPIFLREHQNNMYRTSLFIITKSLASLPFQIVLPVIFTTLLYWMIGLNSDIDRFFIACGLLILTSLAAESYGYLISAWSPSVAVALAVTPPLIIPLMLFGGLFLNSDSTPPYFVWVEKFSFIKYAFEGIMVNEFEGSKIGGCTPDHSGLCFQTGKQVLKFYSMDVGAIPKDVGILIALIIGMRLAAFFVIWYKVSKR